jgi:hypothetical protein
MQDFSPLVASDFLAKVKRPRYKFEIYVGAAWVNLCDLNGVYYLKTISVNPSGAGATADVIAGTWSAEIANPGGIFHPLHPTSDYADYFRIGREVRISIGGNIGGADRYYQRLIGYMDAPKFNHKSRSVSLSGCDYSKQLADTALRSPDNFWGASLTFSSAETDKTFGAEKYVEDDALLCQPPGDDLDVAPVGWGTLHGTFISEAETGGGSDFVGHLETSGDYGWTSSTKTAGAIVSGKAYEILFKYQRRVFAPYDSGASLTLSVHNSATDEVVAQVEGLASAAWTTVKFHFTAPYSCNTYWKLWIGPTIIDTPPYITVYWIDQLTFREVTARVNTRYVMPAACNGVYAATLDGVPYSYGDDNFGWFYDQANKTFYFDDKVWIETGTNNLVIKYFTTQDIMDVLGDVLSSSGLYADRAAALAAMDYTDPAISLDKVWFEPGTPRLAATKQICERCNYRFWFAYDGTPTFKPASVAGTPAFAFPSFGDLSALDDKQDLGQIRNRIVIEGIERGAFSTAKDKQTSRFTGTAYNQDSIDDYLEHTETIQNHLFQDQPTIDAMCATLLAERKDPKWYATLNVPNPVPLEVGDTISWFVDFATVQILSGGSFLSAPVDDLDGGTFLDEPDGEIDGGTFLGSATLLVTGIIRAISIGNSMATYTCEITDYE